VTKVERLITDQTRAIVAVHLHGFPSEIEALSNLAHAHGLLLIEDAAQAHGATFCGRPVGSWGDVGAFSFYPTKNLGALGDGGCITTNNEEIAERVRQLANYGSRESKYAHEIPGMNSRLDAIHARVLEANLEYLGVWNERRRAAAALYLDELGQHPSFLPLHDIRELNDGVWHHFIILAERRSDLRAFLGTRGIETEMHYPIPAYRLPALDGRLKLEDKSGGFPVADSLAASTLSLPLHPWCDAGEITSVCEAIREFYRLEAGG
jgi:dTDP-4-amino-4,6-dideoxygalactose transaminase